MRGFAWLVVLAIGVARPAYADPPPVAEGAASLENGRHAWDKGQFDAAELFYKNALDQGQLAPQETLEAYVRLGTSRAVLGKKDLARVAFRQAALIDWHFKVPKQGGKKAQRAAALAKKDEARLGSIALRATFPKGEVEPGEPFGVNATLDPKHAAVMARIGIDARDSSSGKHFAHSEVALPSVHFDVPADVTTSGATLVVRVDALDAHDNRVATREQRVQVREAPPPVIVEPIPAPHIAETAPAAKITPTSDIPPPITRAKDHRDDDRGGGFWSSPWPYVIGGVALAAGAASTYYFVLRPTEDVSVGSPNVQTR